MSVAVAVFYGVTSGSMSFVNKVVLTSYGFPYPTVLILVQLGFTVLALELGRWRGWLDIPSYNWERGSLLLIPSMCYALHTFFVLLALSDLSIPMYNILRRLVPLINLLLAYLILKQRPSYLVVTSVLLIVLGCVIAGAGDMKFVLSAYTHALVSCVLQALYMTYIQKTGVESDLSALSIVHLNSINCLPCLLVYTLLTSELAGALKFQYLYQADFLVFFSLTVVLGFVLNYSTFLCATYNSALTVSLVGILKSVVTTVIGFFVFGGVEPTVVTVLGVTVNTLGGFLYTFAKYREKGKKGTEQGLLAKTVKTLEVRDDSNIK